MVKRKTLDDSEWWTRRVEELAGASQEFAKLYNMVKESLPTSKIYEKGFWPFMKLLILAYYIVMYTNIAKKRFERIIYVDLFAGPGFNYLEELEEVIAGSPLLAKVMPWVLKSGRDNSFHELLLFDIDPKNCETLRRIIDDATIVCMDSNSDEAIRMIYHAMSLAEWSHYLAFVDPECTELKWKTLEALFKLKGDLIITYMFTGIARTFGRYHSASGSTRTSLGRTLTEFFGTDKWMSIHDPKGCGKHLLRLYVERIKEYREKVVVIPIMTEVGGFQYRMIVATRLTKGGSKWLEAIEGVRDRIQSMDKKTLMRILDVYRNRQKPLTDYW